MIDRLHEVTGADHRLYTPDMSFEKYIHAARALISEHRVDLTPENSFKIIEANAPFEWRPYPAQRYKRGILLVHGLYDSPFRLRDLGAYFLKQGFLVRTVLLPGHGTVPGDLLDIHRRDWLDTLEKGILATAPMVDDFYLAGFSLGAGLCLLKHTLADNLRAMIMLAPGLKARNPRAPLTEIIRFFTWISKKAKWYQISHQTDYTKYSSFAYNPAYQTYKVMNAARRVKTDIPLFFVASSEDETIDISAVVDYFQQQPNPHKKMILYTKSPTTTLFPNTEQRSSVYPEQNIIDFSHTCIPIAPNNPYLGKHGELLDFSHYHNKSDHQSKEIRLGAITPNNLLHYKMQRLSYNPDFDYMAHSIISFIDSLE